MTRKMLMNLQGITFTDQQARDYYGSRFDTAQLVWVTVDEDGRVVEGVDFTHNGKRWSFDDDQLAVWNEVDGYFEFLSFHWIVDPTVESVSRFIDQL